jgi:glycosyltransferase 2 family protein
MKKKIAIILKLVFSIGLLAYLFYKIPLREITAALASANYLLIIAAFFIYLLYIYLSAYESGYLTRAQGMLISTFEILKIHLASMFYNLFLPGLISGGAVKWYKYLKYGSKAEAAAVIAFNRLLETLMLIVTGIVFSIPVLLTSENTPLIIAVFALLFLVLGFYILFLNQKFLFLIEKIVLKIPLPQIVKNAATKIFTSMHRFRELTARENIEIFSLLFLYHSLSLLSAYLMALSLNIDISFFDLAWIRTIVTVLILIPISFSGFGVREASLIFFLGNYGIKSDLAMAFSLLLFLNLFLTSLIGGAIEFINFISGKRVIADKETS